MASPALSNRESTWLAHCCRNEAGLLEVRLEISWLDAQGPCSQGIVKSCQCIEALTMFRHVCLSNFLGINTHRIS